MENTKFDELLEARVHFGHLKSKWNAKMAPYIFGQKNGIHLIDLNKTIKKLDVACKALKQIAKSGRMILFVGTKNQAKHVLAEKIKTINMPYISERWSGGMITNYSTIVKSVKKMKDYDKMLEKGILESMSKKERLNRARQREKLELKFGSIVDMNKIPAALFVIDTNREHIAILEAKKLNIPIFAIVDTNSDPSNIDFAIPANDDSTKSISLILDNVVSSINEGLEERKKK